MASDEDKLKGALGCCGCLVLSLICFVTWSMDTVEPTEWGLKYSSLSKSIDNETIYDGGRYWIWPTNKFVSFPKVYKTIEFSSQPSGQAGPLKSRTKEGLALGLELSFQYQLIKEELPALYGMALQEYENTFIKIARDVVLQAAGNYEAKDYWKLRRQIGNDMLKMLQKEMLQAHCQVKLLQLLEIMLPDTYEESIVQTQVEVQKKRMKEYEQQATEIRSQITVMTSETNMRIQGINATASASAYKINQVAQAQALNNTIQAETDAYENVKTQTGLSGEDLNKYVYYLGLMGQSKAKLLVGLNSGLVDFK